MAYVPPDLVLDVVLPEQLASPVLPLDVTLCEPIAVDSNVSIDAVIVVTASVALTAADYGDVGEVILLEQLSPAPLPLDVVMCSPINVDVSVSIDAQINVSSSIELTATKFVVGIGIGTALPINPSIAISAHYDSNVFRGLIADVSSDMQDCKLQGIDKQGSFENNEVLTHGVNTDWQQSKLTSTDKKAQFEANIKLTTSDQILSETAKRISDSSAHQGEYSELIGQSKSLLNETAKKVSHSNWYSFEAMLARQTERKAQGEYSYLDAIMRQTSSDYNRLVGYRYSSLIETAKLPSWFTGYLPPPLWQTVILREQLAAPMLPLDVVLCGPKSQSPRTKLSIAQSVVDVYGYLVLTAAEDDGTNPQPSTGVIFVTNSVALNRSDDGRGIKLFSFNVGIDANSYCWSFSATVPLSELPKVNTAIEQRIGVELTVNGNLWRFILDGCDDNIAFGSSTLTIKGKSKAMLLAHPYAKQRGFKYDTLMSVRQIAEDELNRSGVPSGFTLDWQLVSENGWQIPANTYSYTGRTPINSLQWIAEAAGGFINADMSADVIHVLERYPMPSWEWSAQTPLLTLPQSLITSRSRSRVNKPAYNGVQVWGEREGSVGALIKRTGTSGGYQPPMVTSDLITDNSVARSRGISILSDTGDIGNIGISMPLHSDFGVLKPSTLIGVDDGEQWVGMVRGTSISGKLGSNQSLEIEQSLDVERHFDKEFV